MDDIFYTPAEVTEVGVDNDTYVSVSKNNFDGAYKIHKFRVRNVDNEDKIQITIEARATMAPSVAPVYLQIYNFGAATPIWETLDTENSAGANEEFTLTSLVEENVDDYYDSTNTVVIRIYQNTEI